MTYFLTKVWGFREPVGPLIFREEGWRQNAIEKLQPGDRVVLVGTQGEPTDPDERGKLLGIMEPTTEAVMSLDFPRQHHDRDYDEQGHYKWPYGLLNLRAWVLLDRPSLSRISDRLFSMDAVSGIVPLIAEEAAKVEALEKREAEMARPSASAEHRIARATGHKFAAPPPSTTRAGVMHMRSANASTYLMELVGAAEPAFKVGWAFDWKLRQRGFNHAAVPELGGIRDKTLLHHPWNTARQAFRMEQALLRRFQQFRRADNNEVLVGVEDSELNEAWYRLVQSGGRRT